MGAGKFSNGYISTGTRIQQHLSLFQMMSGNCFLDSVAGRISNGRLAPEHRILQPNTDQRPTDPDPNFL